MGACKSKNSTTHHNHQKSTEVKKGETTTKAIVQPGSQEEKKEELIQAVKAGENVANRVAQPANVASYKLKFLLGENLLHEGTFAGDRTLESIAEEFRSQLDPLSEYNYHLVDSVNNVKADLTEQSRALLRDVMPKDLPEGQETSVEVGYAGLEVSRNVRREYADSTYSFAVPRFENGLNSLMLYNKLTQEPLFTFYQDESLSYLKTFNETSAFCNGNNKLFISGGEVRGPTQTYSNLFVEFDLANISQPNHLKILPNLINPRAGHSMIFVPPKYVFIVGGSNTKSVEVFDTETNQITHDSNLLEQRFEVSLCCVDNTYLYAICGFVLGGNFVNSFERCNLRARKREWEKVTINFKPNVIFEPSFFTVAFGRANSIVLIGSREKETKTESKNYILNLNQGVNEVDYYPLKCEDYFVSQEKFMLPKDEKTSILLPYLTDGAKVLFFDSDSDELRMVKFEFTETTEDQGINQFEKIPESHHISLPGKNINDLGVGNGERIGPN